ncbi:MAG: glycosyltransferase family 2 protein [Longimicrobiales bacterium]
MAPRTSRGARPCPSLAELPTPPAGRQGWPWTEESARCAPALPDGRPWPTITVVTPSYNQAEFLEATLRSVLLQGYPSLEYLVMDGGSQDASREIIEKYSPWLAGWVSERDRGQSHAVNTGMFWSIGEVQAWLNSDDLYYPGALATAGAAMAAGSCDILIGAMDKIEIGSGPARLVKRSSPTQGEPLHPIPVLAGGRRTDFHFIQPPMFWRRGIWEATRGLDERYHYAMDTEWCSRALAAGATVGTTEEALACFTLHTGSKTQDFHHRQMDERALMYLRLSGLPGFRRMRCIAASLPPARRALVLRARQRRSTGRTMSAAALDAASLAVTGLDRVFRYALRDAPT